jgi:hypothetical protein
MLFFCTQDHGRRGFRQRLDLETKSLYIVLNEWLRRAVNHANYLKGTRHQENIFNVTKVSLALKSVSRNIEHSKLGRISIPGRHY